MFVIDAVIFNEDRHKNNFGFIVNNDTQVIEGMAPGSAGGADPSEY